MGRELLFRTGDRWRSWPRGRLRSEPDVPDFFAERTAQGRRGNAVHFIYRCGNPRGEPDSILSGGGWTHHRVEAVEEHASGYLATVWSEPRGTESFRLYCLLDVVRSRRGAPRSRSPRLNAESLTEPGWVEARAPLAPGPDSYIR